MLSSVAQPNKRENHQLISKHTCHLIGFNGIIHAFTSKHTLKHCSAADHSALQDHVLPAGELRNAWAFFFKQQIMPFAIYYLFISILARKLTFCHFNILVILTKKVVFVPH